MINPTGVMVGSELASNSSVSQISTSRKKISEWTSASLNNCRSKFNLNIKKKLWESKFSPTLG